MEEDQEMMEQEDDCIGLFHKSSLRQRSDPLLPIETQEIYQVKKSYQNQKEFINEYEILEKIGKGAFGTVYKVIQLSSSNGAENQVLQNQRVYAMKVYSKHALRGQRFFAADGDFANGLDMLENEINILKRLVHPNITRCFKILYGSDKIYLINEYCAFGQIMKWNQLTQNYQRNDAIVNFIKHKHHLTEISDVVHYIFTAVCKAVLYLHQNNITNRDIKVDNMLCGDFPFGQIKLTDFTTVRYNTDDISYFPSGTPGFRGPEHQFATSDGYSSKASDIWSIGVSAYIYYHECFPFYGQSELQIDIKAKNVELKVEESAPKWFHEFIRKTTEKNWKQRMTIQQCLSLLASKPQ